MWGLLTTGDINQRHHVPGATGSMLAAPFILALTGIAVIVVMNRWREPWWRFIIFGALVSVIPGALTINPFHTGRMIAYAIFLLVLTIPALAWFLEKSTKAEQASQSSAAVRKGPGVLLPRALLVGLLLGTIAQAAYFQLIFWREGRNRVIALEATYKDVYDVATAMPSRPIYLVDGQMGPGYIHALWYATLEERSTSEFVHLDYGVSPPPGALVISSEEYCTRCEILFESGQYSLYRKL